MCDKWWFVFILLVNIIFAANVYGVPVKYDLIGELHSKYDQNWFEMTGIVIIESEPEYFNEFDSDWDMADRFAVRYAFEYDINVVGYGALHNFGTMYMVSSGGEYHNGYLNGYELGHTWEFHYADGTPYSYAFDSAGEWATLAPIVSWYSPDQLGTIFPDLNWAHGFASLEKSDVPLPIPEPVSIILLGTGLAILRIKGKVNRAQKG